MQLDFLRFVSSDLTNAYVREHGLSIYVRKNIERGLYDLANVTAVKAGRGAYTDFLARFADEYPFRVENVLNDRFADYHRRLGWAEIPCEWGCPTFLSSLAVERELGLRPNMIFHDDEMIAA
jgi:hypothetical protein